MNIFPDLEFYYKRASDCDHFAVECKWKKEHFNKEWLRLKYDQLENYLHYEKITGYPTFLIIGIGKAPSQPQNVYVIPVSKISRAMHHVSELEEFRRPEPYNDFNLEYRQGKLHLI